MWRPFILILAIGATSILATRSGTFLLLKPLLNSVSASIGAILQHLQGGKKNKDPQFLPIGRVSYLQTPLDSIYLIKLNSICWTGDEDFGADPSGQFVVFADKVV